MVPVMRLSPGLRETLTVSGASLVFGAVLAWPVLWRLHAFGLFLDWDQHWPRPRRRRPARSHLAHVSPASLHYAFDDAFQPRVEAQSFRQGVVVHHGGLVLWAVSIAAALRLWRRRPGSGSLPA